MQDLIARTLTLATHSRATTAELPDYFYAALNSLIVHYTVTGRHREALDLARIIMAHVDTFVMPEWVSSATHGLIARYSCTWDDRILPLRNYLSLSMQISLWRLDTVRVRMPPLRSTPRDFMWRVVIMPAPLTPTRRALIVSAD